MLTSRRDYLLRIIDEVCEIIARIVFQRTSGRYQEALLGVVQACERLFNLEADQLFQLTPEQHFAMLTVGVPAEDAREKVLLYAALNTEAGRIYLALGNAVMARNSFLNALRFTLRAPQGFPPGNLPLFAPRITDLLEQLQNAPLDAETAELLRAARAANAE
jgi:hypothetical protein